jgi:hypothetical protein
MVFRRRSRDPVDAVDPTTLPDSCRPPVERALRARQQFTELAGTLRDGPLQARLRDLGAQLDAGVLAVWRVATQIATVDRVAATLDPDRITADLKQARRSDAPADVVATLQARFAATQRVLNGRDELHVRLEVLGAQLDTAVARCAELALTSGTTAVGEIDGLEQDLAAVVGQLDALATATAELT